MWSGIKTLFRSGFPNITSARVQVPPIVGLDSMHGANYVRGAPMFPHALHTASSFNPRNAHAAGRAAARHTRAAGVPWVFAPVLDVAVASRFPRVYETAGEDPLMAAVFGAALVQGLQGMPLATRGLRGVLGGARDAVPVPADLSAGDVVAACMKHFIGCAA